VQLSLKPGGTVSLDSAEILEPRLLVGLQARDEFGHDFRSGLRVFDERNTLSGP
jgi:hypothetical protein